MDRTSAWPWGATAVRNIYHAPDNLIYDFARPSRLAAPFETLWMVFHLIGAIRRHQPDVLFCAGNT